jgi:hypothetical protein
LFPVRRIAAAYFGKKIKMVGAANTISGKCSDLKKIRAENLKKHALKLKKYYTLPEVSAAGEKTVVHA